MIITRETDYALRAMRSLSDGQKKTLQQICEVEKLPRQFGYKLMKKLANDGFIKILRGKDGGYLLGEIEGKSLYDLKEVMGTPSKISPCLSESYLCEYRQSHAGNKCYVHDQLIGLQKELDESLRAVKLLELISYVDEPGTETPISSVSSS